MSFLYLGEIKIIVVDSMDKVKSLMRGIVQIKFAIKYIISVETPTPEMITLTKEHGVKLDSIESIKALGLKNLKDFVVSRL